MRGVGAFVDAHTGRAGMMTQFIDQPEQRLGCCVRRGPHDAIVTPVTGHAEFELKRVDACCERALGYAVHRFCRRIADEHQGLVDVALLYHAATAIMLQRLRGGVQRRTHRFVRPQREEKARCRHRGRGAQPRLFHPASRAMSTTASAAMPSPRPGNPSFSVVLALTLTSLSGAPRSAAILATIAGMWGAMRGS